MLYKSKGYVFFYVVGNWLFIVWLACLYVHGFICVTGYYHLLPWFQYELSIAFILLSDLYLSNTTISFLFFCVDNFAFSTRLGIITCLFIGKRLFCSMFMV